MNENHKNFAYNKLLNFLNEDPIHIINIGLEKFAKTYHAMGIKVVQVDWHPPSKIDDDLSDILNTIA